MSFGELVFIATIFGVPMYLLFRAWFDYLALNRRATEDLLQMQVALALISLSTVVWVAVGVLMSLEDRDARARAVAQHLSPGLVGLTNIFLCIGALVSSRLRRRSTQESIRLRRAIGVSGGSLILVWLFLAANPH